MTIVSVRRFKSSIKGDSGGANGFMTTSMLSSILVCSLLASAALTTVSDADEDETDDDADGYVECTQDDGEAWFFKRDSCQWWAGCADAFAPRIRLRFRVGFPLRFLPGGGAGEVQSRRVGMGREGGWGGAPRVQLQHLRRIRSGAAPPWSSLILHCFRNIS